MSAFAGLQLVMKAAGKSSGPIIFRTIGGRVVPIKGKDSRGGGGGGNQVAAKVAEEENKRAAAMDKMKTTKDDIKKYSKEMRENGNEYEQALAYGVAHWTGGSREFWGNDSKGNFRTSDEKIKTEISEKHPIATKFIDVLKNAPPTTKDLYRGMMAHDRETSELFKGLKVGDKLPVKSLSSFSEDKNHAKSFTYDHGLDGVVITVKSGKMKAVNVQRIANGSEDEWLMAQDLKIVGIKTKRTYSAEFEDWFIFHEIEAEGI